MMSTPTIMNSGPEDIAEIFTLFRDAIQFQTQNGLEVWPQFPESLIEQEILEKRHYKIVRNGALVAIFSVQYSDPLIWAERDTNDAIYLHRITVKRSGKVSAIMPLIKSWAISHARELNKRFVRMDTWGKNVKLRNYYINCGFPYIGQTYLKTAAGEPAHYGGNELSLFELKVDPA
jgi:hypothetical protein